MSIHEALRKYVDVIHSDAFGRYQNDFAQRISSLLSKGYLEMLREPPLVQIVENVVNSVDGLSIKDDQTYFELSASSIFIHGNKSQVEFECYGRKVQRELGDLIFIMSVVFNGRKYFEKLTVSQFKKDRTSKRDISWRIDNKEQLFLLSRFPAFRGVKGLIPRRDFKLPNYSGCLGSYGLLYTPGDFAFVSATELDSLVSPGDRLKKSELYLFAHNKTEASPLPHFLLFRPYMDELLHFFHRAFPEPVLAELLRWNLFGNYQEAHNVFDFAQKYLIMGIGEPTFMLAGVSNRHARAFLHQLLSALRVKAKREKSRNLVNFIRRFWRYGYAGDEGEGGFDESIESDFDGGEIGIVHTILNLGE